MARSALPPSLPVALVKQIRLSHVQSAFFWYTFLKAFLRLSQHLRSRGLLTAVHETYLATAKFVFELLIRTVPSVGKKVQGELDQVTLELKEKLAPVHASSPPILSLPSAGLTRSELSSALDALANLPKTRWEEGRVSGAVYHGGDEMGEVWKEAFGKFEVSNPLHADVFPGVRQMESSIVSICLELFNSPLPSSIIDPVGGCGTTTSGGTESILMACKAYRDFARKERGIVEPEMVVPRSAHAAFSKASEYFGIKIHYVEVDKVTRKVDIRGVKRAINGNTVMLVGSAPNFPDGAIDDIEALSALAVKHRLGLHVDCCLGSMLMPFLAEAGFDCPKFDFRLPGVTSISADTHKYGYAPKGSSVIMYRDKHLRSYAYSVLTTWPGGVYATPTLAGSRPGATLAGAYASLLFLGRQGYLDACKSIVGGAQKLVTRIREDFPELYVLGEPKVSVVAFGSRDERDGGAGKGEGKGKVAIYEVGDKMSKLGWHLNALQGPPALHLALTRLTVPALDDFLRDLRIAVDEVKASEEGGKGSMVMLYGLGSSSAVGPGLVEKMASRYMDVLYA